MGSETAASSNPSFSSPSSNNNNNNINNIAPKILLAKSSTSSSSSSSSSFLTESSSYAAAATLRSRLPSSLNLLSPDSWDLHIDKILPYLTENSDFKVIGVIGTPGSGKSTIMNQLYGFHDAASSSAGMLPPFATQSEETKTVARHCTAGIELRISTERLILLDTQPVFSPSVLAEMMRPDGSSTISLLNGEVLPADLAHELIGIQLGVFLASVCHVLLVVTEGVYDTDMWHLMLTADLLKHGIPDPSSLTPSHSQGTNLGTEKELNDVLRRNGEDYLASPVFVHTKLHDQETAPHKILQLRKTLAQYFCLSSFMGLNHGSIPKEQIFSVKTHNINTEDLDSREVNLVLLPYRNQDEPQAAQYESFDTMLGKLRDQVLSMHCHSFAKSVSEREWLRNSTRIWESVKNSPVFSEYIRTLQSSGMFRS